MLNYWKRRDKELADLKRRKEKFEKEIKKKQEEERELLL
jgi:DNA helicase INO80